MRDQSTNNPSIGESGGGEAAEIFVWKCDSCKRPAALRDMIEDQAWQCACEHDPSFTGARYVAEDATQSSPAVSGEAGSVEASAVKLWHDDSREPPDESWVWARTNQDAIRILLNHQVVECSLDHDMAAPESPDRWDKENDGRQLVIAMVALGVVPPKVTIHSLNRAGAEMMAAWLRFDGHTVEVKPFAAQLLQATGKEETDSGLQGSASASPGVQLGGSVQPGPSGESDGPDDRAARNVRVFRGEVTKNWGDRGLLLTDPDRIEKFPDGPAEITVRSLAPHVQPTPTPNQIQNNPNVSKRLESAPTEGPDAEVAKDVTTVKEALSPITFKYGLKTVVAPTQGHYSGNDLRKICDVPEDHDLYEVIPAAPDRLIGPHDQTLVNQGTRLFSAPRHINAGSPTEGKDGGPKPTGTIFELDLFRERLERYGDNYRAVPKGDVNRAAVGSQLHDLAAELKTLIDNCMKQYGSPAPTGRGDGLRDVAANVIDCWQDWLNAPRGEASAQAQLDLTRSLVKLDSKIGRMAENQAAAKALATQTPEGTAE